MSIYTPAGISRAGVSGKRFVREFKLENAGEYELAQEIKVDIFEAGDKIDATAMLLKISLVQVQNPLPEEDCSLHLHVQLQDSGS